MKKLLSGIITIALFIGILNGGTSETTNKTTLATTRKINTPMTVSEKGSIMGDVDQNGKVDAQDAVQILKYVAHNIELSEEQLKVANTDGIGKVDAQDAVMILKYVAHNITEFPGKLEEIDFSALNVAKTDAAKYKEADYSVASYKKLKDALAMPEKTQKEIDAKVKAIRDAIAGLTVDKKALNTAKTDAAKYKEADYSVASYKKLKDALAMPENTQKQIDAKAKAITDAIAGLTVDKTALNTAKTEAAKYKETDYSIASYKKLKDALAMSEKTQKEIDNKTKAITTAIDELNTDTSKLSVAKIEAAKYAEADYSVASYKKLKDALAMPENTQKEIDAKVTAINSAIAGLTVDKTALNTAKDLAKAKKEADYSVASYKKLKDALAMPENTQKEIDAKVTAINNAIAGLTVDKTDLNTAINFAKTKKETDYSVASYKKLKDALAMPENTQKEIDAKTTAINSAIDGLTVDKTALVAAKTEAEKYKEADYSVATYKILTDALAMPENKQSEIDNKATKITEAINSLEKKLAHVNVTLSEQNSGIKYEKIANIATITSGEKEEKIDKENLEFEVVYTDNDGNEINDQNAIKEFTEINLTESDNGIIVVNFKGNKAGTYVINAKVGTINGSKEIKATVSESTELNYAKLVGTIPEKIRVNDILTELEVKFYHKYTDTDLFAIDSVWSNTLEIDKTGMEVTLLDVNKQSIPTGENKEVKYITIEFTEVGTSALKIKFGGKTILDKTFTVKAIPQYSVKLYDNLFATEGTSPNEINTINLYTTDGPHDPYLTDKVDTSYEDEDDEGNPITVSDFDIYTKIAIYLVDINDEEDKKKIDAGNIVSNIADGKIKIGFYDENGIEKLNKIKPKYYTNSEGKIDYIGIAISNKNKAQELNNGKIKFIYEGREYIFNINAQ